MIYTIKGNVLTVHTDRLREYNGCELADDLQDVSNGRIQPLEVRYLYNSCVAVVIATIKSAADATEVLNKLAKCKHVSLNYKI